MRLSCWLALESKGGAVAATASSPVSSGVLVPEQYVVSAPLGARLGRGVLRHLPRVLAWGVLAFGVHIATWREAIAHQGSWHALPDSDARARAAAPRRMLFANGTRGVALRTCCLGARGAAAALND